MRTKKQKWASERCWCNKGGITGAAARLRQIANCASTLPEESEELKVIAAKLGNMTQIWNDERIKKRSWKNFKEKN